MKKISIFSGVPIDRTPIVKYAIREMQEAGFKCEIVEMKSGQRVKFILQSFKLLFWNKNDQLIFIGLQTLPLLFISQIFKKRIYNWFLESYSGNESNTLVMKLVKLEKFIDWKNIVAIFPNKERSIPYDNYNFLDKIFIPNVAPLGRSFLKRKLSLDDKIKLVFYGALSNDKVYLEEIINFVKDNTRFELDLYGSGLNVDISEYRNINYNGLIDHSLLLQELSKYHFSIIGYRPLNFNTKYCVPNKLYEAFSLSLPVILNSNNPTLSSFSNLETFGLLIDFTHFELNEREILKIIENYSNLNKYSYCQYIDNYNLENVFSQLESKING